MNNRRLIYRDIDFSKVKSTPIFDVIQGSDDTTLVVTAFRDGLPMLMSGGIAGGDVFFTKHFFGNSNHQISSSDITIDDNTNLIYLNFNERMTSQDGIAIVTISVRFDDVDFDGNTKIKQKTIAQFRVNIIENILYKKTAASGNAMAVNQATISSTLPITTQRLDFEDTIEYKGKVEESQFRVGEDIKISNVIYQYTDTGAVISSFTNTGTGVYAGESVLVLDKDADYINFVVRKEV